MAEADLNASQLYINRELSWLEFNDRVLREGMAEDVPLLERLKFLAIVSSNLDEFFMIRVAGLKQQRAAGRRRRDISGMTPARQLSAIRERVLRMVREQSDAIGCATAALAERGIRLATVDDVTHSQRSYLAGYFTAEILPVLTPLAVEELNPPPILPGSKLHLALLLVSDRPAEGEALQERLAVLPVPSGLPRFIAVPTEEDLGLVRLESVIAANVDVLFPGRTVVTSAAFRVTRDADVAVDEEDAAELLEAVEEAVRARHRRAVVRLEISSGAARPLRKHLMRWLDVQAGDVYAIEGMLDATALMGVAARAGFDKLKYPDWPPQPPRDLLGHEDLWATLRDQDVLLFHPYESFDPVVQLMELAAEDPDVLAVKQTLYRTSGDSPVIRALVRAAENGKQVTVLVELKARFDEARNVNWARQLEDAGCYVIYGIAGYKTHSKALLIVRREARRIRRYLHLSTGNYNDKTAKLYSDIGLMTSDRDMTADAAAYFNLLTGYSQTVGWNRFSIAPTDLRRRFVELIDREIQASTPDRPGLIMAKVNSLHDKGICEALYRASQAGVRVLLNVRGICCLRPHLEGVSENIEVVSIVDRYLEHARIFYFRNGGHEEVYLSSADWMVRNIDKRLEILFPVQQKDIRRRLIGALRTFFADNVKARRLGPNGTYEAVARRRRKPVRAQETFYRQAIEAARPDSSRVQQFRPLARPRS